MELNIGLIKTQKNKKWYMKAILTLNGTKKNQPFRFVPFFRDFIYSCSTFSLAQGVRLRNVRLDLMEGSWLKHRIFILAPISSQPYWSTRASNIWARVLPCKGLLLTSI